MLEEKESLSALLFILDPHAMIKKKRKKICTQKRYLDYPV